MASQSFAFVPRNISKNRKQQGTAAHVPSSRTFESTPESTYPGTSVIDKGKGKAPGLTPSAKPLYNEEDVSILLVLAFSDYALWVDSDLRRKIEESYQSEEHDAGFLPLGYLMRRPIFKENLAEEHTLTETNVAKAIRTYASDVLEVRMLVSVPPSWSHSWKLERNSLGCYEARRKDWSTLLDNATRVFTRTQWDDHTIYMENLPPQYHTIPGIIRFTQGLLSQWAASSAPIPVQNVILPPHHLDKPGDRPQCKGFALVTLYDTDLCRTFCEKWPWRRPSQPSKSGDSDLTGDDLETKEASKFGFRTLPRIRWDELNKEYLAYRQKLIGELADNYEPVKSDVRGPANVVLEDDISAPPQNVTTVSSWYPVGCLVFIRNLHSETNKTTLRALFATAFKSSPLDTNGLDYVDFNKGMDCCYLRLASPEHAYALVDHFSRQPVLQSHGLDDIGKNPGASEKAITTEIIQGKKEEIYWEKVPEKVRRQAMEKALGGNKTCVPGSSTQERSDESRSRRKRKR